ncbi:MAG: pyrimidine dimer DNA glycosylase/endonuclease V [Bdellovibrionota bacterium]
MRLWSIHPKYLDAKGLVALWRESLLAKKVLEGKTKGYTSHPQLDRFKKNANPLEKINSYLHSICDEADQRGYCFDRKKLVPRKTRIRKITVTQGQIDFEWKHLQRKLFKRSRKCFWKNKLIEIPDVHPSFKIIKGGIEDWEILESG